MNEELKRQFLAGTETEKITMLLAFAVHLTILARGEYPESKSNPEPTNETLHRLMRFFCLAFVWIYLTNMAVVWLVCRFAKSKQSLHFIYSGQPFIPVVAELKM